MFRELFENTKVDDNLVTGRGVKNLNTALKKYNPKVIELKAYAKKPFGVML